MAARSKSNVWQRLKSFDAYPKLHEDVRVRTVSGAAVSLASGAIMVLLFFSELSIYLSTETVDHLFVDTSRSEKLLINIEASFPHVPCALLSLDVMDLGGSAQDVAHNILKIRLDRSGQVLGNEVQHAVGDQTVKESIVLAAAQANPQCGSCYGAESKPDQCCNTCEEVREAYKTKGWSLAHADQVEQCDDQLKAMKSELAHHEGCRVQAQLHVAKVQGNFHFAPGQTFSRGSGHIHDLSAFQAGQFNVTHVIDKLSFGQTYPGQVQPLDGTRKAMGSDGKVYKYFIKVVPTTYEYRDGRVLETNQFSVTEYESIIKEKEGFGIPGVFFFYDIAPIKVDFKEESRSFLHFVTQLCAIIGGVFTVAGLLDKVVYNSLRQLEKGKLGKLG